jgi:proteasome alpha subunit
MNTHTGYDYGVIFSPDGRLYQVEYARKAIEKGITIIGINASDGIIIAIDKKEPSKLIKYTEKIFTIDDHIIAVASGIIPDAREIIANARYDAQNNRATYDEPINTETLVKKTSDYIHYSTRHAGTRPFGVSLLFAGIDDNKTSLFETDPSGAFWECNAAVIGANKEAINKILEKKYTDNMTITDAEIVIKSIMSKIPDSVMPEIYIFYNK